MSSFYKPFQTNAGSDGIANLTKMIQLEEEKKQNNKLAMQSSNPAISKKAFEEAKSKGWIDATDDTLDNKQTGMDALRAAASEVKARPQEEQGFMSKLFYGDKNDPNRMATDYEPSKQTDGKFDWVKKKGDAGYNEQQAATDAAMASNTKDTARRPVKGHYWDANNLYKNDGTLVASQEEYNKVKDESMGRGVDEKIFNNEGKQKDNLAAQQKLGERAMEDPNSFIDTKSNLEKDDVDAKTEALKKVDEQAKSELTADDTYKRAFNQTANPQEAWAIGLDHLQKNGASPREIEVFNNKFRNQQLVGNEGVYMNRYDASMKTPSTGGRGTKEEIARGRTLNSQIRYKGDPQTDLNKNYTKFVDNYMEAMGIPADTQDGKEYKQYLLSQKENRNRIPEVQNFLKTVTTEASGETARRVTLPDTERYKEEYAALKDKPVGGAFAYAAQRAAEDDKLAEAEAAWEKAKQDGTGTSFLHTDATDRKNFITGYLKKNSPNVKFRSAE